VDERQREHVGSRRALCVSRHSCQEPRHHRGRPAFDHRSWRGRTLAGLGEWSGVPDPSVVSHHVVVEVGNLAAERRHREWRTTPHRAVSRTFRQHADDMPTASLQHPYSIARLHRSFGPPTAQVGHRARRQDIVAPSGRTDRRWSPCCRTRGHPLACGGSHHSWVGPRTLVRAPAQRVESDAIRCECWIMMSSRSMSCGRLRRVRVEAHLPTEQPSSCSQARLPQPHEHSCWPCRAQGTPSQGPSQAVGLIWRIRERSVFARLSHDGVRARAGVLWCTFLPDPSASPPRVAFAIGRAVGPAVVRNQVRRRLRALLGSSSTTTALPPGWYLIGGRPAIAERSFPQLSSDVEALVASVRAKSARHMVTDHSNTSSSATIVPHDPQGPDA
jgi:ribonuclease P protein component